MTSPYSTGRLYALEGRMPTDDKHRPQLALIIIEERLSGEDGGTCIVAFGANVEIKEIQHQEIKKFHIMEIPPIKIPSMRQVVIAPPNSKDSKIAATQN